MKKQLLLALSIIILSTTTVFAQGRMHRGRGFGQTRQHKMMRNGDRRQLLLKELNLSSKQQTKIEEIRTKYSKTTIDLEANSQKIRIDKQTAMKNNDFSKAKKLTTKLSALRGEIQKNRISEKEEIWNQLNDEQKKKAKTFMLNKPFQRNRHHQGQNRRFNR